MVWIIEFFSCSEVENPELTNQTTQAYVKRFMWFGAPPRSMDKKYSPLFFEITSPLNLLFLTNWKITKSKITMNSITLKQKNIHRAHEAKVSRAQFSLTFVLKIWKYPDIFPVITISWYDACDNGDSKLSPQIWKPTLINNHIGEKHHSLKS